MNEATVDQAKTIENGSQGEARTKTAYISAPKCMDTGYVRSTLESKGVKTFSPDQLDLPGQNLSQILRQAMERADLVVAVVDPTPASNFVFYELGFAQALRKPTIVLLTGDVSASPWAASGIPYFRFDPAKPTGLEFGINQILKVNHHETKTPPSPSRRTRPLAERADELLTQLRDAGDKISAADLEAIVERAVRDSGVASVSRGQATDKSVDLAVWSDDLSPWVANPLPIQVRLLLRSTADMDAAVRHLARLMAGGSMPWGLLIYLRLDIDVARTAAAPNILCISAEQFLEALRSTSFGDLIRWLRNQQVHGGS
ncbi:MAG TPA: nucleoside 2-deoxyribosyltransferase [Gemmataceae bacterium]|jgi:hypothetical protein|nr:nucleoside 2-deoxyribosyltransferase [Gemmataceae bacterium]